MGVEISDLAKTSPNAPASNPSALASNGADKNLEVGARVLRQEADALAALASSLDQNFVDAVEALLGVEGRVIVSGLGKSGHIARKIAATLASTGTPAQHVHPSEASHGDLGMIISKDVVIMLSNSGENRELSDLIAHTRLAGITLIGISSQPTSTLIVASDIGLILPQAAEACPMGMAPTTSTTMMIALGDALAVALMERRGFSKDDYRVLHPGGQLGKSLIRVESVMHSGDEIPLVQGDATMKDMLAVLVNKRFGCVGMTDESGRLIGIFTDGDLGRNLDDGLMSKTAFDVMTKRPQVIGAEALVVEAIALMEDKRISCLFVVDTTSPEDAAPTPLGILHVHDCIGAGLG